MARYGKPRQAREVIPMLSGLRRFKVMGVVEIEVVALDETDAKLEAQRTHGMDVRHIEEITAAEILEKARKR